MAGLGDVDRVVKSIHDARADLVNATAKDGMNHPKGKTPKWLITEFGSSCNQGFGDPDGRFFPSAIHDMIDQSSYTISTVAALAGAEEPQALSYWAISDVFEERFFPVHNESFHGMFGMVNLHGIPKPTYRAYQLLHETGDTRLGVTGPPTPLPPKAHGQCGPLVSNTDVFGGDIDSVRPCSTCGLFTMADCCSMCLSHDTNPICDTAELWVEPGETLGYTCALKQFAKKTNITHNVGRNYVRVTGRAPVPPPSNDDLCATNAGVLAVRNGTSFTDLLIYNHAAFADPIVDCAITVAVTAYKLATATVRRVDEAHANPLAAWIAMGAPDYTTAAQNAALLTASELVVEKLADIATIGYGKFTITVPTHGVAAVRIAA